MLPFLLNLKENTSQQYILLATVHLIMVTLDDEWPKNSSFAFRLSRLQAHFDSENRCQY